MPVVSSSIDPSFRRAMVYIFVGTRGGFNRARVVELLGVEPMNAHKISERLKLDYKTVQYHLKLLEENQVIVPSSPKAAYGAVYFLTPYVEKHLGVLRQMWPNLGKVTNTARGLLK
ncbi:MAG TPA: winged helix-turn-helix domain-containing protein [Nitrososphaerales archaeon]|nr:winged helix-turn-helix domain-containing protein [Nitrososphaerales archaeon]